MKTSGRILLYGGSFDPPHRGHERLFRAAVKFLSPDRAFIIPAGRSPFKEAAPVSYRDRCAMVRRAFSAFTESGLARLSSFEGRPGISYTYKTVNYFRGLYPEAELWFLMGSDCLEGFFRWNRKEEILSRARLLVGSRPGYSSDGEGSVPFTVLKGNFPGVSSTSLRTALLLKREAPLLGRGVREYIEEKGLYFGKERKKLRLSLSPGRYRHSAAAAAAAADIAAAAGLDPQKAVIAGFLHDAAREWPPEKLLRWGKRNRRRIPFYGQLSEKAPALLHCYASAAVAEAEYGIKDRSILSAIESHSIGPADDILAKIIYTADYCAPGRKFRGAAFAAEAAVRNAEEGFLSALRGRVSYAVSAGLWLHPRTVELCSEHGIKI